MEPEPVADGRAEGAPERPDPGDRSPADQEDLDRGLRFGHYMMSVTQAEGRETKIGLMALASLLTKHGVISSEEFSSACEAAREHLGAPAQPRVYLASMGDKYAEGESVEIDCASRIHLCQARCCTFNFFLTGQDLDEGAARWDYGNPYWIRRRTDGYCVHCDPGTRACGIHARRPHICRKFDCRQDKRIWLDFERRIPAEFEVEPEGPAPIAMGEPSRQHSGTASQAFAADPTDGSERP